MNNFLKHLLRIALLQMLFTQTVLAQSLFGPPVYTPPSVEASSLGSYAENPVSYYTGTPKIEIPLFEITSGRIKVPINLSYHAIGIKVDQQASRCGMGWNLNAGGVVTRSVKGFPDELDETMQVSYEVVGKAKGYFNHSEDYSYLNNSENPRFYDLEPDPYFYNFGDKSGKFYFEDESSVFFPKNEPYKIKGPFDRGEDTFEVITEEGLIYRFENSEGANLDLHEAFGLNHVTIPYTASWFLTEIEDPITSQRVHFYYRNDAHNFSYKYYDMVGGAIVCGSSVGAPKTIKTIFVLNPKVLSRIEFDGGYVELKSDHNRQDLLGDFAYTEINLFSSDGVMKKGFNLSYVYTSNGNNPEDKRLYLDAIRQKSSSGTFLPDYKFEYKNPQLLPSKTSGQQDVWGYYNGNGGTGFFADYGTLSRITYPTKGYVSYEFESHNFGSGNQGGIRIKNIKNYSPQNELLLSKSYFYNLGELGGPNPTVQITSNSGTVTFTRNRSVLGTTNGSYVGYGFVNEIHHSSNPQDSMNISYNFLNARDVPTPFTKVQGDCVINIDVNQGFPFFDRESRESRRGLISSVYYFGKETDQAAIPYKKIEYTYQLKSMGALKVYSSFQTSASYMLIKGSRNINKEKMLLISKTETENDRQGQPVVKSTTFSYTPDGNFIRSERHFSLQQTEIKLEFNDIRYKYPFDYGSTAFGGAIGTMVGMNYISPRISEETYKYFTERGTPDQSYFVDGKLNYYAVYNGGLAGSTRIFPSQMLIAKADPVLGANTSNTDALYEQRLNYDSYDVNGNPLQYTQKVSATVNGPSTTYLWDYNGQYPVAEARNATQADIAYTSFEADGKGNWTYAGIPVADGTAPTGKKAYIPGNNAVSKTGLAGSKKYVLRYWAKGSTAPSVSGSTGSVITAATTMRTRNGWTQFSRNISNSTSLSIGGSMALDDIRLYPKDALVTTYTYDPLVGMTSKTDEKGAVTYYEYDEFQRLKTAKNLEGMVVGTYDYHYKQP